MLADRRGSGEQFFPASAQVPDRSAGLEGEKDGRTSIKAWQAQYPPELHNGPGGVLDVPQHQQDMIRARGQGEKLLEQTFDELEPHVYRAHHDLRQSIRQSPVHIDTSTPHHLHQRPHAHPHHLPFPPPLLAPNPPAPAASPSWHSHSQPKHPMTNTPNSFVHQSGIPHVPIPFRPDYSFPQSRPDVGAQNTHEILDQAPREPFANRKRRTRQQPAAPRQFHTKSCDQCKMRKVRCDGASPCGQCIVMAEPCHKCVKEPEEAPCAACVRKQRFGSCSYDFAK